MNLESLGTTFPLMLKGMGGIFIVILVLYALIKILLKVFPSK